MKEKLINGDEQDAVWARGILKCFSNHTRPSKIKRRIRRRRRHQAKNEIRE